jgi:hypothetical protein
MITITPGDGGLVRLERRTGVARPAAWAGAMAA